MCEFFTRRLSVFCSISTVMMMCECFTRRLSVFCSISTVMMMCEYFTRRLLVFCSISTVMMVCECFTRVIILWSISYSNTGPPSPFQFPKCFGIRNSTNTCHSPAYYFGKIRLKTFEQLYCCLEFSHWVILEACCDDSVMDVRYLVHSICPELVFSLSTSQHLAYALLKYSRHARSTAPL